MTAFLIIAALLGGLCWAGRSRRIYRDQFIADDVDVSCESSCDDTCSSDSYDSYDSSSEDAS